MTSDEMIDLVKALSDADRLRIVGALTQKKAGAKEIAAQLGLTFRQAINHLHMLTHAGVVRETDGIFDLDSAGLETLARRQFEGQHPPYAPAPDLNEKDRRVLAAHLNPDGTIREIPLKPAKRRIVLDYLVNAFTAGASYTEQEVNLILARFHPDTSSLRRDLVDAGLLRRERDGSRYWRRSEPAGEPGPETGKGSPE